MKVTVTQNHITDGKPGMFGSCPIALAIKDIATGYVSVSTHSAVYDSHVWSLPVEAQDFVNAFDNNWPVQPFSFDLEEMIL